MCERWVGDWTDCNILTPSSSDYSSTSFSFGWAAQPGAPEGPSSLLGAGSHCLELQLELQLTDSNYGTRLYNCLTSTCFPWASQLHRIQPVHGRGYILICSTGCTCFLIDGWVEGQYVTECDPQGILKEIEFLSILTNGININQNPPERMRHINSREFRNKDRSPKFETQTGHLVIRLSVNKKKGKKWPSSGFFRSGRVQSENKRKQKYNQLLGSWQKTEKSWGTRGWG